MKKLAHPLLSIGCGLSVMGIIARRLYTPEELAKLGLNNSIVLVLLWVGIGFMLAGYLIQKRYPSPAKPRKPFTFEE